MDALCFSGRISQLETVTLLTDLTGQIFSSNPVTGWDLAKKEKKKKMRCEFKS